MFGFIYTISLLYPYHQDSDKICEDFNLVLASKKLVKVLLLENHVSLEDKDLVESFIKMADLYRECVI